MELNRKQVIQELIDHKGYKNYLEIGVFLGHIFFAIKARRKIGVDPNVEFSFIKKLKRSFKYRNPSTLSATSIKLTSDEFFEKRAPQLFRVQKVDICFVDGMHEYDFALRDVENTLHYLEQGGVIIMHDCNPLSAAANVSFEDWEKRGFTGEWNGDVWKAIVHLRSFRKDINVFVLDCDQGLGIVTFGKPETQLNFTEEQIRSMQYAELESNRTEWLNLKPPSYFYEFFNIRKGQV